MMHIFQAVVVATFTKQFGGHLLEKKERENITEKGWHHRSQTFFFNELQQWIKYLWVYSY